MFVNVIFQPLFLHVVYNFCLVEPNFRKFYTIHKKINFVNARKKFFALSSQAGVYNLIDNHKK